MVTECHVKCVIAHNPHRRKRCHYRPAAVVAGSKKNVLLNNVFAANLYNFRHLSRYKNALPVSQGSGGFVFYTRAIIHKTIKKCKGGFVLHHFIFTTNYSQNLVGVGS